MKDTILLLPTREMKLSEMDDSVLLHRNTQISFATSSPPMDITFASSHDGFTFAPSKEPHQFTPRRQTLEQPLEQKQQPLEQPFGQPLEQKQQPFGQKHQKLEQTLNLLRTNHSVSQLLNKEQEYQDTKDQDPFYIMDLGELKRQARQWNDLMPRIKPFYAVKCNPDPAIIETLKECGTGFDCASKSEIQLVLESGVDASRIIYANPTKQGSHITYAMDHHVNLMTFDNIDELYKIKKLAPNAKLVLRILTDDSKSICRFGVKFGASLEIVPELLETAKLLGLEVIGVSFHVGSGCFDESSFTDAVKLARKAFDIAIEMGWDFKMLDIGGGFPGNQPDGLQFPTIANVLRPCIDLLFPKEIQVIAEPGRYFASSCATLAVNVIARRSLKNGYMYYINEGMYGSFNCITFDHAVMDPKVLTRSGKFVYQQKKKLNESDRLNESGRLQENDQLQENHKLQEDNTLHSSSIWGPTCDSIDLIGKEFLLPEMKIGDWLVCEHMGAYTMAAASNFNGFTKSKIIYTDTQTWD